MITHLGCWENTRKACNKITRLGSWFTIFFRVLPTSRLGYHASKPIEGVVYCLSKEPGAKTNFIRSINLLVFFSRLNSGNIGHQFWRPFKLISWTVSKEDTVEPRYKEPLYKKVLFKFRCEWGTSHFGGISHFEQVFAKGWVRVVVSKRVMGLFWRTNEFWPSFLCNLANKKQSRGAIQLSLTWNHKWPLNSESQESIETCN